MDDDVEVQVAYGFRDAMYTLRMDQGMTQKEFAEALKVNKQTISGWERGRWSMKVDDFIEALANLGYEFYIERRETTETEDADLCGDVGVPDGPGSTLTAGGVVGVGVRAVGEEGQERGKQLELEFEECTDLSLFDRNDIADEDAYR